MIDSPMNPRVGARSKRHNGGEPTLMTPEMLAARVELDGFTSVSDLYRSRHHRDRASYEQRHVGRAWTSGLGRGAVARAVTAGDD